MPPVVGKKVKGREGRRSSSRHTTPSSTISASIASPTPTNTAFLEIPISNLAVPANVQYDDILERHGGNGGNGGIPDPKHLETMAENLRMLAKLAQSRTEYNDRGMRALATKRKEVVEQEREREQEAREHEQKETARREAEVETEARERKTGRAKEKKRSRLGEEKAQERPLNHGAHGLARQDGLDLPLIGVLQLSVLSHLSPLDARDACVQDLQTAMPSTFFLLPLARYISTAQHLFYSIIRGRQHVITEGRNHVELYNGTTSGIT